jgi:hypothetical protein
MLLTLAAAALHLTHPLALLADPAPQLADQRLTLADGAELALRRPAIQRSAPPRPAATWPALERRFGVAGALWDPERGAPIRLWGAGIAVPGAIDHPQRAADFARALLRDHLDVLAPAPISMIFFRSATPSPAACAASASPSAAAAAPCSAARSPSASKKTASS